MFWEFIHRQNAPISHSFNLLCMLKLYYNHKILFSHISNFFLALSSEKCHTKNYFWRLKSQDDVNTIESLLISTRIVHFSLFTFAYITNRTWWLIKHIRRMFKVSPFSRYHQFEWIQDEIVFTYFETCYVAFQIHCNSILDNCLLWLEFYTLKTLIDTI